MKGQMQISKERGYGKKYLIIKGKGIKNNYEIEFLKNNEVGALLPFYTIEKNGEVEYWYDITGKKSIEEYVEENGIELNVLFKIFSYAKEAFFKISEYLIKEENIFIRKDTMFLGNSKMYLCYYPEKIKEGNGFSNIGECIIENTDNCSEDIIKIAYSLYQEMSRKDFYIDDAIEILKQAKREASPYIEKENDIEEYIENDEKEKAYDENISLYDKEQSDIKKLMSIDLPRKEEIEKEMYNKNNIGNESELNRDCTFFDKCKIKYKEINKYLDKMIHKIYKDNDSEIVDKVEETQMAYDFQVKAKLLYDGNEGESDFILNHNVFKIGRDTKKSNAILHSDKISKHHSKIYRKEGNFYLMDWNSKHGTYLNGKRLKKGEAILLKSMDRICFADVPYRFA